MHLQLQLISLLTCEGRIENSGSKLSVALLFGESNFISLSFSLLNFVDLIVIADVEPRQLRNLQFILNCFKTSTSPAAFLTKYLSSENPILNEKIGFSECRASTEWLEKSLATLKEDRNHFLSSEESYQRCKCNIPIVIIKLNALSKKECQLFSQVLQHNNALVSFANLTNIHNYDFHNKMMRSLFLLFDTPERTWIMFSTFVPDSLETRIVKGLKRYFTALNESYAPRIRAHGFFGNKLSQKSDVVISQSPRL